MLQYVALMKIDQPALWSRWHNGSTAQYNKSPIFADKASAEKWLRDELKNYPDSTVNEKLPSKKYYIFSTIIAFDDDESNDFDVFLNHFS